MVVGGRNDGEVVTRPDAQIHAQLGLKADDHPGMKEFDLGFVDPEGKFYTRTALGMDASQYRAALARGESPAADESKATYSPAARSAKDKRDARLRAAKEAAPVQAGSGGAAPAPVAAAPDDASLKDRVEAKRKPADAPPADPASTAPPAEASPTDKESLADAEPKTKRPPKSFRKKVLVTTTLFDEQTGKFVSGEIDADSALSALDADIAELAAFRRCLTSGGVRQFASVVGWDDPVDTVSL